MRSEDDRTLRLAAPVVTPERVDQLLRFQRAWLAVARSVAGTSPDALLSAAHQAGLEASGLPGRELGGLDALARSYCGQRWTEQRLAEGQAEIEARLRDAQAPGAPPAPVDLRSAEGFSRTGARRPAAELLARRYGPEA